MGKHEAPDGSTADPIVADALAHRSADAAHHAAETGEVPVAESPVGWPGTPAPEGDGLGWPAGAAAGPAPRGWRRLFGLSRVA